MTHSEEIETLAPGFPTPWRLVHCQGPRATIQCADGTLFSIGVQAKRHQELKGLVRRIMVEAHGLGPQDMERDL